MDYPQELGRGGGALRKVKLLGARLILPPQVLIDDRENYEVIEYSHILTSPHVLS